MSFLRRQDQSARSGLGPQSDPEGVKYRDVFHQSSNVFISIDTDIRRHDKKALTVLTIFVISFVFYSGSAFTALVEEPDQCTASDGPAPNSPLIKKYKELGPKLKKSIFGEPIILSSDTGKNYAQGEVYVLLNTPFFELDKTLSQPSQWCELAILHQNIKTCVYDNNQIQLYVGRKHYQEPLSAFAALYQFSVDEKDPHSLNVKLSADKGPLGTHDYLISLEAISIDDQHSFVHFTYRYQYGFWADVAMRTYLATIGRNKVGFTSTGQDEDGEPIYIKGLQGVVERNVMRYIFAIQSVLEARKSPEEYRQTAQLVRWYAHISKHPKQLVGLTREEYLDNKKREIENQKTLQKIGFYSEGAPEDTF
jgi:hypothetical protein